MNKRISILANSFLSIMLVVLTGAGEPIFGQGKEYVIPFQLTDYNNISVQAILNKKDTLNLMFHTAADGIMLTEAAVKKINDLNFDGVDSLKSWGGSGNTSRFSKSNTLQIGELEWTNMEVWEDVNSGRNTDGKFGIDLFSGKVIEINFDKKVIVLRASLPGGIKKYDKLKLIVEKRNTFIEATCRIGKSVFSNKFLIHSGYSGAVLFDDQFVADHQLAGQLKIVDEKELKDSYGHVLKTQKAILPTLVIGKEKLQDVPVGFFQGAIGRQKMSIFGGDILKRFNIVIDAQREYIYLTPNHLKGSGYFS